MCGFRQLSCVVTAPARPRWRGHAAWPKGSNVRRRGAREQQACEGRPARSSSHAKLRMQPQKKACGARSRSASNPSSCDPQNGREFSKVARAGGGAHRFELAVKHLMLIIPNFGGVACAIAGPCNLLFICENGRLGSAGRASGRKRPHKQALSLLCRVQASEVACACFDRPPHDAHAQPCSLLALVAAARRNH